MSNVSVLVAIGVNSEGYRRILGICEGAKEDKADWSNFLRHLKERGLKGVRLFITDAYMGLVESLGEFYPETDWCPYFSTYLNKQSKKVIDFQSHDSVQARLSLKGQKGQGYRTFRLQIIYRRDTVFYGRGGLCWT